jgi:hypothetical protein
MNRLFTQADTLVKILDTIMNPESYYKCGYVIQT